MGPWSSCVHLRGRGAAPGARPRPEPAGSSSAGAAMLGCSLGLGPICLLLPCRGLLATVLTARLGRHSLSSVFIPISFHSLDLPRHRVPDPGDVRVLGKALQAPGFEPPGPKWSGGTPHPLAWWPHQSRVMPVQGGGCCSLVSQVRVPHCYQRGPFFQRGWLAMQRAIQVVAEGWQSQEFGTKDM